MGFTRPQTRFGGPPVRPQSHTSLAERMTERFLARALPTMTDDERFAFEERIAICMFDGNLTESEATRVALSDFAAQRARSKQ
jgi:hypothetical protein